MTLKIKFKDPEYVSTGITNDHLDITVINETFYVSTFTNFSISKGYKTNIVYIPL